MKWFTKQLDQRPLQEKNKNMMSFKTPGKVDFHCSECNYELSFTYTFKIISDDSGYYYVSNTDNNILKLHTVIIQHKELFEPFDDQTIPDMLSVRCPVCNKLLSCSLACAVFTDYSNGIPNVLIQENNGINRLPIVLLLRITDDRLLPLCILNRVLVNA